MKKATFIISLIEGILNVGAVIASVMYGLVFLALFEISQGGGSGGESDGDPTAIFIACLLFLLAALLLIGSLFSFIIAGICQKTPTKKRPLRVLGILNILCLTPLSGILSIVCSTKQ